MIDPGIELEPDRAAAVRRLGSTLPDMWSDADLATIRENMEPGAKGIPTKHVYGSDFPYREVDRHLQIERHDFDAGPSLARGGFSNVWGGVTAPYPAEDLTDWPISARDLAPHYEAVLGLTGLAAQEDNLAALLPLYSSRYQQLRSSIQASSLLGDVGRNHRQLESAGIHFGQSRLAVRSEPAEGDAGCVYCGLCLYGCPYGLIYNSQSTMARLETSPLFHYRSDVIVERVEEHPSKVRVQGRSRGSGTEISLHSDRVFLACGTYSTTKILLESLEIYDEPLTIQDSQYFLLPLLRFKSARGVESESLHTLAQAFCEIRDPAVTRNTVHMEVFTYNDLLPKVAAARLGLLAPLFRAPVRSFLSRLIVNQCFLHSDVSPSIIARLSRSEKDVPGKLVLEGQPNPEASRVVGRVWRKLLAHSRQLRAVPIPPLIQMASPGRGFHSGGAFPMKESPGRLESDVWGRPTGLERVHAVDATTLTTVPATTITLPVMANAHRIGAEFPEV